MFPLGGWYARTKIALRHPRQNFNSERGWNLFQGNKFQPLSDFMLISGVNISRSPGDSSAASSLSPRWLNSSNNRNRSSSLIVPPVIRRKTSAPCGSSPSSAQCGGSPGSKSLHLSPLSKGTIQFVKTTLKLSHMNL